MKQRILILLVLLALTVSMAMADGPTVNDVGLELLDSSVHYPQLSGLADPDVQSAINAQIMASGQIETRLNRLAALMHAPVSMTVSYTCTWFDPEAGVFSCAILADGAVENSRSTQVWASVNCSLVTGEAITWDDLFTDGQAAAAYIGSFLNEQVAPELSAHLAAGSLTPLPDTFTLSPTGLTLYYPIDQFRTLGDRAGTVCIPWSELTAFLRMEEGDVLHGAAIHLTLSSQTPMLLEASLQGGSLMGIPAALGQSVPELITRYALMSDPDGYEGGRMISLEDGAFRQVWILTDDLTDDLDNSVVQGIRADRLNLYGLCTGQTTVAMWRTVLGEPDMTITVDESEAESWRIVPGNSDYYTFGVYRLRLHADENGVLRSVFLTP